MKFTTSYEKQCVMYSHTVFPSLSAQTQLSTPSLSFFELVPTPLRRLLCDKHHAQLSASTTTHISSSLIHAFSNMIH